MVQVNKSVSTNRDFPLSVPQGRCAGPVLYNTYASSLPDATKSRSINDLGYADDQLTYDSFRASSVNKELCTVKNLEDCLGTVNT